MGLFWYSCATVNKISSDIERRAVPLQLLRFLCNLIVSNKQFCDSAFVSDGLFSISCCVLKFERQVFAQRSNGFTFIWRSVHCLSHDAAVESYVSTNTEDELSDQGRGRHEHHCFKAPPDVLIISWYSDGYGILLHAIAIMNALIFYDGMQNCMPTLPMLDDESLKTCSLYVC